MSAAEMEAARARVREFLRQRARSRHHDPHTVTGIHTDPAVHMAELLVEDLQLLSAPPTPSNKEHQ